MKKYSMIQKLGLVATFLMMGVFISACDSNEAVNEEFETTEVQDLFTVVSSELDLSSDQQTRFKKTLRIYDHSDRQPGYLWIVADELAETLTDEQKDRLFNPRNSFDGRRGPFGGGDRQGFGGPHGGMGNRGGFGADGVIDLTEEQQGVLEDLRAAMTAEMKVLREKRRAGEITNEVFINDLKDLRQRRREEFDVILTDDQKAALEEYRKEREREFEASQEETRAVRDRVLGLTTEQSEALDAIREDQRNMRELLMEQLKSDEITRAEIREQIEAFRIANLEALELLLSESQFEIVRIHAALLARVAMRGRGTRGGGPG